jgi:hypothetical protein
VTEFVRNKVERTSDPDVSMRVTGDVHLPTLQRYAVAQCPAMSPEPNPCGGGR